MTDLAALGKLKNCKSFPRDDVDADLLSTITKNNMIRNEYGLVWYTGLIPALVERQRKDRVAAIKIVMDSSEESWRLDPSIKG